jgi:hypothetical protein
MRSVCVQGYEFTSMAGWTYETVGHPGGKFDNRHRLNGRGRLGNLYFPLLSKSKRMSGDECFEANMTIHNSSG